MLNLRSICLLGAILRHPLSKEQDFAVPLWYSVLIKIACERQEKLLFIDIEEDMTQEFEALETIIEMPDLESSGASLSANDTRFESMNYSPIFMEIS